jgi:dihydroflavonol-4-reductase
VKIFLTGGTGFIGQSLAANLLGQADEVVALVRKPSSPQARALAALGVRLAPGDVTERESMRPAMSGADMVVHNAGHYEFGLDAEGRKRMEAINVRGTANTLGLARELGVPRAVYVSSVVAFGESGPTPRDESFRRQAPCRSWYEQTKTDAHAIALREQQQGLPLITVCPAGVIGPNDHSSWGYIVRMYVNRISPPTAWAAEKISSLVDRDDLARGIALAAAKGRTGEVYLLCGEARSLREHLSYWKLRPGGFGARLWLPSSLMALSLWPAEPLQRMAGLPAFLSRETVRGADTNLNYSGAKAIRELGWSHRSARDMWLNAIDGEIALLAQRQRRDLIARLKPVEPAI